MDEVCQFFCCTLCKGLFTDRDGLVQHRKSCDGSTLNSTATLFACAKPHLTVKAEEKAEARAKNDAQLSNSSAAESLKILVKSDECQNDHDYTIHVVEETDKQQTSNHHVAEVDVEMQPVIDVKKKSTKRNKTEKTRNLTHSKDESKQDVCKVATEVPPNNITNDRAKTKPEKGPLTRSKRGIIKRKLFHDSEPARDPEDKHAQDQEAGEEDLSGVINAKQRKKRGRRKKHNDTDGDGNEKQELVEGTSASQNIDTHSKCKEKEKTVKFKSSMADDFDEFRPVKKYTTPKSKEEKLKETRELVEKYREYYKLDTKTDGTKEYLYHCPECPKTTKHIGFFNRHLLGCHPPPLEGKEGAVKAWKCEECDYVTDSKPRLVQHRYKHRKKLMCEICSQCFALRRDLETHRWVHKEQNPYKCDKCDYSTRFPGAMKEHARKHTGELLRCGEDGCTFTTAYDWALRCHRNSKHTKGQVYQCKQCKYQTTTRGSLVRHHKMHLGMREYKCSMCNHTAVSKHEIVRHLRRHTKEKVYFCNRCSFSTSYCSGLKIHLMQHMGIKPWQCSLCGFNSITKQRVQQHQANRHPSLTGHVVNLGLKLNINVEDYKREKKPGSVYTVSTVETTGSEEDSGMPVMAASMKEEVVVESETDNAMEEGNVVQYSSMPQNVYSMEEVDGQFHLEQPGYSIQYVQPSGQTETIIVQAAEGEDISELQFVVEHREVETVQDVHGPLVQVEETLTGDTDTGQERASFM